MKLLIAVHHLPPNYTGGAELRAVRTAHAMQDRGHRVKVVCIEHIDQGPDDGVACHEEVFQGVPVSRLSMDLSKVPGEERREYDNAWIGEYFEREMQAFSPDLFHLLSGYLITGSPLNIARTLNIPTVVSLTDFWFLCPRINLLRSNGELSTLPIQAERCVRCLQEEKRRYLWLGRRMPGLSDRYWSLHKAKIRVMEQRWTFLKAAIAGADQLISPSNFLRSIYIQAGIDPERIVFSRQGYDCSASLPVDRKESASRQLRMAYIGQLAPHKGVHILLMAFKILAGETISLKVYGNLNGSKRYVESLRNQAGHDARIEFCGTFRPADLAKIYRTIDILAVPSTWYENSPNVILEAFAQKTPVLASNLGGMKELVQDGQNGLLFEAGNPEDLAAKITCLIEAPELLDGLASGIKPPRSLKEEMDDLERIYREIVPGV
jgi:glycosyltransferase involved in cell wall biosynthesis